MDLERVLDGAPSSHDCPTLLWFMIVRLTLPNIAVVVVHCCLLCMRECPSQPPLSRMPLVLAVLCGSEGRKMYLVEEQGESYLVRPRYKREVDEGIPLIFKVNFEAVQKKGLDKVLVRVVVTEKFPLWGESTL